MTSNLSDGDLDHRTDAEIEAAIRTMSDIDLHRLGKIADFRAQGLKGRGFGIDADDLLQEAFMRTVEGKRRWKNGVPFVKHLIETMRSIANHVPEELKGCTTTSDSTETSWKKDDTFGAALVSRIPDAERIVAAQNELTRICNLFKDDEKVGLLIEGLSTDMTGPEIQKDLGISQREYETAMTKLRRGARQGK